MIKKILLPILFSILFLQINAQVNFATAGFINNSTATPNAIFLNNISNVGLLHNFAFTDPANCNGVITGPDGKLYGVSLAGGAYNKGTIFSINDDGSNLTVIYNIPASKYFNQLAPIPCFGSDGKMYINIIDSLFKIDPNGSSALAIAKLPFYRKEIVAGNSGWLYGIGDDGADHYFLYRIQTDGTGYQIIHSFDINLEGTPGNAGNNSLCVSPTGRLYGFCFFGGANGSGSFYSLRVDGSNFIVHKTFTPSSPTDDGYNPTGSGNPVQDNGKIFFSTNYGGVNSKGKLYAFDTTSLIINSIFDYPATINYNKNQPIVANGQLIGLNDKGLYSINENGTNYQQINTIPLEGLVTYSSLSNQIFYVPNGGFYRNYYINKTDATSLTSTSIHDFGNVPLSYNPDAIFKAPDGLLYGYAKNGGATGGGTIFKMNVDGSNFQNIHYFDDANGQVPIGQMLYGSDGRLYGVCDKSGTGGLVDNRLIFGMNTDGTNYTVLKTFTTAAADGRLVGELVEGTGGNLYGCTGHADFSSDGSGGGFTIEPSILFKINKNGTGYTVLKRFNVNGSEGRTIRKGLTYYNGFLYGCCRTGGINDVGTCFRINENGTGFVIIKYFSVVAPDRQSPDGGLTLASNNKLYGSCSVTYNGFTNYTFSINPADLSFQVIYATPANDYSKGYLGTIESKIYQASDSKLYQSRASGLFVVDVNGSNPNFITSPQYGFYASFSNSYSIALSYLTEIPNIIVLPVKLTNFSAYKKNTAVSLSWQTAQEVNVEKYEVEKSNNGTYFSKIITLNGKENPGTQTNYETEDTKPFMGNNYYRLKIIDKDGKIEYSPIRVVNFSPNSLFSIYPNPADDIIQIESLFTSKHLNVSINDNMGKTVKQIIFSNLAKITIDVKSLPAGIYTITIHNEKEMYSSSFLKK
jgi:uncharacterized repeat protein (TIGR03803 family)